MSLIIILIADALLFVCGLSIGHISAKISFLKNLSEETMKTGEYIEESKKKENKEPYEIGKIDGRLEVMEGVLKNI
jgi:hypothetical protein